MSVSKQKRKLKTVKIILKIILDLSLDEIKDLRIYSKESSQFKTFKNSTLLRKSIKSHKQ